MPRANRHFLPGHVWHITHRCHKQEYLLRFAKDRTHWVRWLFEAKKRYGLCVLNYVVTSNHIHLLVKNTGKNVIPDSMQLMASRTAQLYNQRKKRKGAFWEDRYHATVIESDHHLFQCLVYIDMNMIRAGVVNHPGQWRHGEYNGIQQPRNRYTIIDTEVLMELGGFNKLHSLQTAHKEWVEVEIRKNQCQRQALWSDSIAVGSKQFVEQVKESLGIRATGRKTEVVEDRFVLKEPDVSYNHHFVAEKTILSD